jgi:Peptidase S46
MRFSPILLLGCLAMPAYSDEGMWLFNDPPKTRLKEKYNFDLTDAWLENARLASVRLNNGGSGSFVSPHGLVITNHHVASDSIQKLSTPKKDLYRDGFLAKTPAEELKCSDLELNVLREIVDVTDRVNAAVAPGMTLAQASAARRARMAEIEKDSLEKTQLRSDVVTLYQGGAYHLYIYKKYTDVRLVMAPEAAIAGFGGDVDNFEFPRFNLDISFFRVYENDKPAETPHFLKINPNGPAEGDLVFVTGHPGTTNRMEISEKLVSRRDKTLPYTLARLRAMEAALIQYGERGPEEARQIHTDLHSVANRRKATAGMYQGLLNPETLKAKRLAEKDLEKLLQGKPELASAARSAREKLWNVLDHHMENEKAYNLVETGTAFPSELFDIARKIVRLSTETAKPNGDRLREYRDSNLDSLKFQLFSNAPIYPELERVKLLTGLSFLAEQLGGGDDLVEEIFAGQSPAALVTELLKTKLADGEVRKSLVAGGANAVAASTDPMILFAKRIDAKARSLRKDFEEQVEEPERQGYAELAKVRFALLGRTVAPDATFTLRIAFGVVKGYEADGHPVPYTTTFGGTFEKAERLTFKEPFSMPKRWIDGKAKLDLSTPFNFVSTADTIGGNSGSPILNRAGEFVGINFDRNRFGLVRNFVYTDYQARHMAVHSMGILEALTKLYDCPELLKEIGSR